MSLSPKNAFFIACTFFVIGLVQTADKAYELQLHKYLVGNINTKYAVLKQDLQKGKDMLSFQHVVNKTSKDGVEMEITWKSGYKSDGVYFCRKEKMNAWKQMARDIFYAFVGRKCEYPKDKQIELKNSFNVKTKAPVDIAGTILITMYINFYGAWERTVRFDFLGTAKAK